MTGNVRDAIANSIQERWPNIKITDYVEGSTLETSRPSRCGRINVEYLIHRDIGIRIATIDINGEYITATFYDQSKQTNTLLHPQSLIELEDSLTKHIESFNAWRQSWL